jgi:starvation-inducible DNA-binding protein
MNNLDLELNDDYKGNTDLAKHLAICLSSTVLAKFIAQGYHWNVKGIEFSQLHDFFGEIYEDYESAIDPLGESIRKLGYDAPYLLTDFVEISDVREPARISSDAAAMVLSLYEVNASILKCLKKAFNVANNCNEQGIADTLAGRIDMHQKWNWQLGASVKLGM